MRTARLAWTQLRRDLAAGEVRIMLAALVLAVLAVTAVGFVTDRAGRALAAEANRLLGGDAIIRSNTPIDGSLREAVRAAGLSQTETVELDSMIRVVADADADADAGGRPQADPRLGDLRALGEGYPLRGTFRLVDAPGGIERDAQGVPAPGTAWLSRAGADQLGVEVGAQIGVGELELQLTALVAVEPDASIDYFNVAPKVFLNLDDLPATGLLQEGSRARYRLVLAGEMDAVERFVSQARDGLQRGQRIETIQDGRPEVRSALDRAGRFLGLAAMVSVVLAAVAVAMAARRHSERHLSGAAVMRCLGASQSTLVGIHVGELALLSLLACTVGVALAFALQWLVAGWVSQALGLPLPVAGWLPALEGYAVGLVVLMAFGAPPVLALRRVPALRVLRRDLDPVEPGAWIVAVAALAGLAALLWLKAGSPVLASAMLGGILATLAVLALLAWVLIFAVRRLRSRLRGSLRYGLANVSRRAGTSVAQVAALGLGLMALLLLTFVRTDLLDRWQLALGEEAPNRFIVNVQQHQMDDLRGFIADQGVAAPELFPMVRARYVALNGERVTADTYAGEDAQTRRRAEREFNLSMAAALRDDNRVTAGRFWQGTPAAPEFSVEEDFARQLGWKVGDRVAFDIAGQRIEAPVTSLRAVEWESFRPNFFVLASPGALDGYPASWITAVSVPADSPRFTAQLVERFPNLSVIDIDAVLVQVRSTADQVSVVVQAVFWFSLAAGVLVLLAAVSASQDERLLEGGVMRVLGGSRRQLRLAQASEFAAIGLLAGLVAAIAASVLSGLVATQVFDLPWTPNWLMAAFGGVLGMLVTLVAGLFATRRVLDAPPSVTLRELQG